MKSHASIIAFILCLTLSAHAQDFFDDYSFYRNPSIPVVMGTDTLAMAWAGGINSVRFSEIDLNEDGVLDLLAFEKHGNRLLPFLRVGNHYVHAPEYTRYFPDLHDWMLLHDYNNDGKPDIFTYGLAGITVYKNISSNGHPDFHLVTEQLQAYYYNGYVNIYASPDDYLVVDDIDHDGHLDILNFWILGKYVHHLRNYSDDPNVFDFRLESECWGHFEEASDNNVITLFSDCDSRSDDGNTRHTGSSMLLHDMDGNGLPDLLLGDVDSPHLILLYNHGTLEEARMTAQETAFPAPAPVQLHSMPAPSLITLPGQSQPSLLASPSDPSLTKSQDLNSVWRYDYDPALQQYTLTNTAFLQEKMVDVGSGCYPVLHDWDQDGLLDLFVSNYGSFDSVQTNNGLPTSYFSSSIQYYKNIGTGDLPAFQRMDEDFGRLKALNRQALYPTFGDFDGDGETDMLCGEKGGTLLLVPHARLLHGTGDLHDNYKNIDVGNYSAPTFFDLDNDGHNDLIIGKQRGLLSYYRNTGEGEFEFVTDSLGRVDTRDHDLSYFGYSTPCFYRDATQGTILVCGSEKGDLFYYNDIDNNLDGEFTLAEFLNESDDATCDFCARKIREGKRIGVALGQLSGDNYPDLLVGNYAGGLAFFQGRTPVQHGSNIPDYADKFSVYPNPTTSVVRISSSNENIHIQQVAVYDLYGRLLMRTSGKSIDLSNLPNGMYLIEINQNIRKKVVKQ